MALHPKGSTASDTEGKKPRTLRSLSHLQSSILHQQNSAASPASLEVRRETPLAQCPQHDLPKGNATHHSPAGTSGGSSAAGRASTCTGSTSGAARCRGARTRSSWRSGQGDTFTFKSSPPPALPFHSLLSVLVVLTVPSIEGGGAGTEGPQHAGPPVQAAGLVELLT